MWTSMLPGLWQVVAPPPLAQVRLLAAEASAVVVIAALIAPSANNGAMWRSLMVIVLHQNFVCH